VTKTWSNALAISAMTFAATAGCARSPEPPAPPLPRGEIFLGANAKGDAAHPAEVHLALAKGALRLMPGSREAPLVAGSIRAGDPTLLPHVTVNPRGVAVVQDFTPDEAIPSKIAWDLTLGATPMRLFVHVAGSEEQHIDLGGRPIVTARLYNEGGHLDVDWSAPSPITAEHLELWSIGYLEARHVALSRAKRIEVKSVGLAEIDLGDRVDSELRIDVQARTGTVALTVPASVTARAIVESAPAVRVEAEGWDHESQGPYVLGAPGLAPRVTIVVHASSGLIRLRSSPPP
jgi:hypothetical protein